jgi:hypothetical protein
MPRPFAVKPDINWSAQYALLQSHEPLPPTNPISTFDDPVIRKRVGEVIAKAMERK